MKLFDGSLKRARTYRRLAKQEAVRELAFQLDPFKCNCCGRQEFGEPDFDSYYEDNALVYCRVCNYDEGACCNFGPASVFDMEMFHEELIHILPIPGLWKRKLAFFLWKKCNVQLNPTVFHPGGRWD